MSGDSTNTEGLAAMPPTTKAPLEITIKKRTEARDTCLTQATRAGLFVDYLRRYGGQRDD